MLTAAILNAFYSGVNCVRTKRLLKLRVRTLRDFLAFCQKPLKSWISFAVERRFIDRDGNRIPNPKWRPFVVKQSKVDTKGG